MASRAAVLVRTVVYVYLEDDPFGQARAFMPKSTAGSRWPQEPAGCSLTQPGTCKGLHKWIRLSEPLIAL
jgi:hypothetical protein